MPTISNREDFAKALRTIKKAKQGDAQAQFILGLLHQEGRSVPQDDEQAKKWFRQAAEQGHSKAQQELQLPTKVCISPYLSILNSLPYKMVTLSNTQAQYQLGMKYMEGRGLPQDFKQAANWFHKAAKQGYPEAQYRLGIMYRDGIGIKRSTIFSIFWLRKAAKQGHSKSQEYLGKNKLGLNIISNRRIWLKVLASLGIGSASFFALTGCGNTSNSEGDKTNHSAGIGGRIDSYKGSKGSSRGASSS